MSHWKLEKWQQMDKRGLSQQQMQKLLLLQDPMAIGGVVRGNVVTSFDDVFMSSLLNCCCHHFCLGGGDRASMGGGALEVGWHVGGCTFTMGWLCWHQCCVAIAGNGVGGAVMALADKSNKMIKIQPANNSPFLMSSSVKSTNSVLVSINVANC